MELSVPADLSPAEAVNTLAQLHAQLRTTLVEIGARHEEVYAQRTRATYDMLRESVETGSHGAGATSILGLVATCHDLRDDWDRTLMEAVEPILHGTRGVVRAIADRFGVSVPLLSGPASADGEGEGAMDLDTATTTTVPSGTKRRRVEPSSPGDTQRAVLEVLRPTAPG